MSKTDEDLESLPADNESENEYKDLHSDGSDDDSVIYDSSTFISGPIRAGKCTMPEHILKFDFSYGYNCRKLFNLVVLDSNNIVFASGNFINFLEVDSKNITFRRSALGGGIGHIRQNPNPEYPHFAVAECGTKRAKPLIILYEWPTLNIVCLLKDGAEKIYANLDYSLDGELLVSQSGEPDYLITVWNWHKHKILLRTKSYVNDIFRVKFSPYVRGQLTTCGLAHIKFWNMSTTFTGLKLKGELGRFGKTEYSDIYGILPMPDEKVVSGCDWGNILIWDEGLITLEVFRSLRRTCHDGPIMQFFYDEGELWTVSLDGHIRVWWYEKIDQADPPDDDRVILLDPSSDFYIPGTMLYSIMKQYEPQSDETWYFAQDGNGGIWLIDLTVDPQPPNQIYKCHAGEVVDVAACPYDHYLASLGKDGRLYLYDYIKKKLVFNYEFPAKGACMIWFPLEIIPYGDVIVTGFDDGQLRVCSLTINSESDIALTLLQVTKPHNKPLTQISVNSIYTILVSSSEDQTIFIFSININNIQELLIPIGLIPTPDVVTCITWCPFKENEVLVGCIHGQMMQVEVPTDPQSYTEVSFLLEVEPKYKNFVTYKAQILRDIKLNEIEARKAKKREKKRKEMVKILQENPGLEIDEEIFLADSESEEELDPLFIPEVPNRILWLKNTQDYTIWVSMGGYDAGYIYEYQIDQKGDTPYRFKMVDDAGDTEISSYIYSEKKDYLIFAMQDGSIRVNKVNENDFRDLSDYWILAMHDNQNGFVPRMCFSNDEKYFFSCGHDGNVFSYHFQPDNYTFKTPLRRLPREELPQSVQDVNGYKKLSMEETKIKAEKDRIQKVANERKTSVRATLKLLQDRYHKVLSKNSKLLPTQIITKQDLELDDRVTEYVEQDINSKLVLLKRKLAYDLEKSEIQMNKLLSHLTDPLDLHPLTVRGINQMKLYVITVRQRRLRDLFYDTLRDVEQRLAMEMLRGRQSQRPQPQTNAIVKKTEKTAALEYFLLSLSPSVIEEKLGPRLNRMLRKYRARREKWDRRIEEWDEFMAKKPVAGKNHPEDERQLEETKLTIGDYKLKESDNYKPTAEERQTTLKKYHELLKTRLKQYNLKHDFSQKVWDLRDQKYAVRNSLIELLAKLKEFHGEIPREYWMFGPDIPDIDLSEFPEEDLKPKIEIPEEDETSEEISIKNGLVMEPTTDEEEKELIISVNEIPPIVNGAYFIESSQFTLICEYEFNKLTELSDVASTPFEKCKKLRRLNQKLFNQNYIVKEMEDMIENFNRSIQKVQEDRLQTLVDDNFIKIFIITLNQELNILKQFEEGEDVLTKKVNANQQLVHDLQDNLDIYKYNKNNTEIEMENLVTDEDKIYDKFKHVAENNKFYNFLKKVFKKKYKPPKSHADEDTSSESSTSSSSEESQDDNASSIDSRDFGYIKQDLNVCPKGCEPAIYDLTVELRSQRHEIEMKIREQQRILDQFKKDMEVAMRKMNGLISQLKASEKDLDSYQREKQRQLNRVNCNVVLNFHQIVADSIEGEISDCVVFSNVVLSNLYKRVGYLEKEEFQHKEKYETYFKHLTRMKKDIVYMKTKLKTLKNEMVAQMYEKFGKIVNISELELAMLQKSFQKSYANELEEVALKKMVNELRIDLTDVKSQFLSIFSILNEKIARDQELLAKVIKENTLKLELLEVISKEKEDMLKTVLSQPKVKMEVAKTESILEMYAKDVQKLESILKDQQDQIQELKNEIKMLKTKGLPPPPIGQRVAEEAIKRTSKDSLGKKWSDYDSYIEEETLGVSEDKHFVQEIKIPGYFSTESEDLIRNLLKLIFDSTSKHYDEVAIEKMVRSILLSLQKCQNDSEIVEKILETVPVKQLSDQMRTSIENVAKKLQKIQEPDDSDETFEFCAKELLEEILNEAIGKESISSIEMIASIVETLIETVPVDYLLRKESLCLMVQMFGKDWKDVDVDKDKVVKIVEKTDSIYKEEMVKIINGILDRIFENH